MNKIIEFNNQTYIVKSLTEKDFENGKFCKDFCLISKKCKNTCNFKCPLDLSEYFAEIVLSKEGA